MKILIFAQDYPPRKGGIETCAYMIAKYLAKSGDDVWVIAPKTPENEVFDQQQIFKTLRLNYNGPRFIRRIFLFSVILRFIYKENIEYVFLSQWFTYAVVIRWIYLIKKIPYGIYCHGNELWFKRRRLSRSQKRLIRGYRSAAKIFANSLYVRNLLIKQKIVFAEKITLVNPGVEVETFASQDNQKLSRLRKVLNLEDNKTLVTVARLVPKKGHEMIIEVLPSLLNQFPRLRYLIVGDGKNRGYLEKIVEQKGLQKIVKFLGKVDHSEIHNYYQLCDIYIMPSRLDESDSLEETFGISYIEASACGKPVIAGNSGGVADAVVDGVTGILVDTENATQLADTIKKLLLKQGLSAKLGQAGYKRVVRGFTWENVVKNIRDINQKVGSRIPPAKRNK